MFFTTDVKLKTRKNTEQNKRRRLQPRIYDFSYSWCRSHLSTLHEMIDLLNRRTANLTVLDIGCGNKPLQTLFPKCKYLGIDINPESAADIIIDCNRDKLPFNDNSVDVIIMSNSLEHIYNTQQILQEIKRVIGPGGFFYFSVPMTYPIHAHPHDYIRFTSYYFQKAFESWEEIILTPTNSLFSTPLLLGGQILAIFLPGWVISLPIMLNNLLSLFIDKITKTLLKWINVPILEKTLNSCTMELNGIYQKDSQSKKQNNSPGCKNEIS